MKTLNRVIIEVREVHTFIEKIQLRSKANLLSKMYLLLRYLRNVII
jgi:hypothetical protein